MTQNISFGTRTYISFGSYLLQHKKLYQAIHKKATFSKSNTAIIKHFSANHELSSNVYFLWDT